MYLTVAEVAAKKHTTKFSVHRWIKSGLPFRWMEGKRVIAADDLAKFTPRKVGNPNFGKSKTRSGGGARPG